MIRAPRPGQESTAAEALLTVYDAWNRPAKVYKDSNANGSLDVGTDALVAEYRCDGLNQRIVKLIPNGENWDRTDYYYNESWQCMEERYGANQAKETLAANAKVQYVWDIRYIDAPVCRDEDKTSDGDCTDAATGIQGANAGDEHLYYANDANMNVTALVDGYDGAAVERYTSDPYGKVSVRNGVRDSTGTATTEWNERTTSTFKNEILYCGYRLDPESGLYHVRNRSYHATLGRWTARDPIDCENGMGTYEYGMSSPSQRLDPSGCASLTIKQAVDIICTCLEKYKPFAKAALCEKICPEIMLAAFTRESRLDPQAYDEKKGPPKGSLADYPDAAGLGGVLPTTANEVGRVVETRLKDYKPPSDPKNQTGADAFVNSGTKKNTGTRTKPRYEYDNPQARAARWDPQANSDIATLTMIDRVSGAKTVEEGVRRYGAGETQYGQRILGAAGAIAQSAQCKDPKCCTCDELKAWAARIGERESDEQFRKGIYKLATGHD